MALNIKNKEVEELASELARLTGESKTEAIRRALLERKAKLSRQRTSKGRQILEREIWTQIPEEFLGKGVAYQDHSDIMGWGSKGY